MYSILQELKLLSFILSLYYSWRYEIVFNELTLKRAQEIAEFMEKIKEKEAQLKEDKDRNLNEKHLLNSKRKELEEFYEEE